MMEKILIVDDVEQNLYMLQLILEHEGYEVEAAINGKNALERARRDPPDLIISDILMPVMDGFTLCCEWRRDPRLKRIPFVFYTATYTDRKDEELALKLGADLFLRKPLDPDEIVKIVLQFEGYDARTGNTGMLDHHSKQLVEPNEGINGEVEGERNFICGEEHDSVPGTGANGQDQIYKLYNERLVQKLEAKMFQLEDTVTQFRESQEQLQRSLDEKEILLKELYHRTKNNMHVICGMLELQSIQSEDTQSASIFREIENRIQSMALVHKKLYQSSNLSNVNFREYVTDLAEMMTESYQVAAKDIDLQLDVDSIPMGIDIAIPCGLVLNELFSNTFKYAFPKGANGRISVRVHRQECGDISMEYSDSGVGLPQGYNIEEAMSLGMNMIRSIVEHQLRGTVDFIDHEGLTCTINFNDNLYSGRL
jgi:two-component sensor histidine kinase/ActR/RegA family two-component response regulator